MDLIRIATEFNTEEKCLTYLEKMRWPKGVCCIATDAQGEVCGSDKVTKFSTKESRRKPKAGEKEGRLIPARHLYQCQECGTQFTAKSGTLFNDTHLPLTKWFLAVTLMTNAKKGLSAKQMERDLGVKYQTAWFLCHRIRESMRGGASVFAGTVEMDEVFIGGRFDPRRHEYKLDHKMPVVGVLKRAENDTPSQVQAVHVKHVRKPVIAAIVKERVSFDARVFTDEGSSYRQLAKTHKHEIVIHSRGEYARGECHINSLEGFWSLVKRQIIGQHHWVSVKHLQSYLNERVYGFNNRQAEDLFGMVIASLAIGVPLPYAVLTAELETSEPA
jgi:transposase-like protein